MLERCRSPRRHLRRGGGRTHRVLVRHRVADRGAGAGVPVAVDSLGGR